MNPQENIDARMYRKSTHLAAADLDIMQQKGIPLVFEIEKVWYEEKVNVSGDATDGYFCRFTDRNIKDMVLNSTNRKTIAGFAKLNGFDHQQCWNIGNWKGIRIELYALRDLKAFGKVQDAIRIQPIQPKVEVKEPKPFTKEHFKAAFDNGVSIEKIKETRFVTKEIEKAYAKYTTDNSGK